MKENTDPRIKEAESDSVEVLEQNSLRVKVADLRGWLVVKTGDRFELHAPDGRKWKHFWSSDIAWTANCIPDYPNDLNACHEFEKDAPIGYWRRLGDITGAGGQSISLQQWKRIGLATGTERCRAYIYEMEATP